MDKLIPVFGWLIAILIGLLGLAVVWLILIGKINLQYLLSETNGYASLSRFQFLIFTFVIALSLYLIIVHDMKFPDIPPTILALLGISSGSYVVSKGIQASKEVSMKGTGPGNAGGQGAVGGAGGQGNAGGE